MVDKKYVGIAVLSILSILMIPYAMSLLEQPKPLTPQMGSFKGMCDQIDYSEISDYADYERGEANQKDYNPY